MTKLLVSLLIYVPEVALLEQLSSLVGLLPLLMLLGLDLSQQLGFVHHILLLLLHLVLDEFSDMLLQDVNLVLFGFGSIIDRAFTFFEILLHAKRRGVTIGNDRIPLLVERIIYLWPLHDAL